MKAIRPVPRGGWLRPRDGAVEFVEIPPREMGADVALAAARFAASRTIGRTPRTWIEELSPDDLVWTNDTTTTLIELLRRATAQSWTFLADVNFFTKVFPGLAEETAKRTEFTAVESLRETTAVINADSDTLLLAAFFGHLFEDRGRMADALSSIRLQPDTADEIVDLVSGARLLLASIEHRHRQIDDRFLNHIAHGLRRPGIVERSRLLAEAFGRLDPLEHAAMIGLTTGVQAALAHPELLDASAESLEVLLRREAMDLTDDPVARARIAEAPTAYVLAHDPAALVRHVRLIEPPPTASAVRVSVEAREVPGEYVVNVVCRDRSGLLSRLTAVLATEHLSVSAAGLATWPDGTVMDSFVVSSPSTPDALVLTQRFEDALGDEPTRPVLREPLPAVELDNSLHPLHSVLRVTGQDQIGLLSAVTHAISSAGVVIHHAAVRTTAGVVDDDFEVSRPDNSKIDTHELDAIREHVARAFPPIV